MREYKVFVPSVQKNKKGISWGEGKDNNGMGAGKSISLDEFYVAKPTDSASDINKALDEGKNIYFTPGTNTLYSPSSSIYRNGFSANSFV